MKIEVIHNDSSNYSKFTKFVAQHNLLFHSPEWISMYPPNQIKQCAILNKNNDIIGCFVYYIFKKYNFNFVITPPFSPNIELFVVNPAESIVGKNSFIKDNLNLVADYFKALNVDYINLNLSQNDVDSQPFIWKSFNSRNRYTYLIDLLKPETELLENLSSEKRKSLNKAQKDELKIEASYNHKLVFDLVIQSLDRNDKAKNTEIIKKIIFDFANPTNSFAFVAYQNGKAIASSFCLIQQSKAIYLFGGFDSENKHHGAGVSCMWQSILKAKELNLTHFDFEGSMNEAIERYFREFGGELKSYICIEKIKPALQFLLILSGKKPI